MLHYSSQTLIPQISDSPCFPPWPILDRQLLKKKKTDVSAWSGHSVRPRGAKLGDSFTYIKHHHSNIFLSVELKFTVELL